MKSALQHALIVLCLYVFFSPLMHHFAGSALADDSQKNTSALSLEDIMAGVEKRYSVTGFSATFLQTSTIKAMDITDHASGSITVKRPGKMRWEYTQPPQLIVTDGKTLWVYKPQDNQVMVGSYPTFFGDGKGASFLSDMNLIRQKFTITFESVSDSGHLALKLVPKNTEGDISKINLLISKNTFDIIQINTTNTDGDETEIQLKDIQFHHQIDDRLFQFNIQDNMDVLQMDQ